MDAKLYLKWREIVKSGEFEKLTNEEKKELVRLGFMSDKKDTCPNKCPFRIFGNYCM